MILRPFAPICCLLRISTDSYQLRLTSSTNPPLVLVTFRSFVPPQRHCLRFKSKREYGQSSVLILVAVFLYRGSYATGRFYYIHIVPSCLEKFFRSAETTKICSVSLFFFCSSRSHASREVLPVTMNYICIY